MSWVRFITLSLSLSLSFLSFFGLSDDLKAGNGVYGVRTRRLVLCNHITVDTTTNKLTVDLASA